MSKKLSVEEQFATEQENRAQLVLKLLNLLEEHSPKENTRERSNFRIEIAENLLTMVIHDEVMPESYIHLLERIMERINNGLETLEKVEINPTVQTPNLGKNK